MEKVAVDDVDPSPYGNDVDRRKLADPLDTTDVAINRYRLAPGDGFPGGLHAHADQEEVFVVPEGTATFETVVPASGGGSGDGRTASEGGEVTVPAGEAIRFSPGEFQSGGNAADEPLVAVAIGAPARPRTCEFPCRVPRVGTTSFGWTRAWDGRGSSARTAVRSTFPVRVPSAGARTCTPRSATTTDRSPAVATAGPSSRSRPSEVDKIPVRSETVD